MKHLVNLSRARRLTMLALLCLTTTVSWAYSFEVDGIYYNKNGNNATVTFRDNTYNSYNGDVVIPETVTYDGITYPVTAIGANTFYNCSELNRVVIPAGVTSIGSSAFYGCSLLDGIVIPEAVTKINERTFYNCTSLKAINIPAGVTSIGDNAFSGCNAITSLVWNARSCSSRGSMPTANIGQVSIGSEVTLLPTDFIKGSKITEVNIPESVTSIGSSAFSGCTLLTGAVIPSGVASISGSLFYGCTALSNVVIPAGVTSIGSYAFYNCSTLPTVAIPAGVTAIGSYAFYGCSLLDGIVIPEGVTKINERTFYNCTSLKAINIPAGVTSIGDYAFKGCNAITSLVWNARSCSSRGSMPTANIGQVSVGSEVTLLPTDFIKGSKITEVNIPATVVSIGSSAFSGCTLLTGAVIPSGVASISGSLFYGCTALSNVVIPAGVTSIGSYAFYNCSTLPTVAIPAGVTAIGSYAFYGCSLLDGIVIPEGVTKINERTFYNCTSLKAINIPAGVTSIGDYAFSGCNAITSLVWNARSCSSRGSMPTANIGQVSIGSEVTLLPTDFIKGSKITEVNIPATVVSIGSSAFSGCTLLTGAVIPSGVASISGSLFYGCTALSNVVIPAGVTSIGSYAFYNCSTLPTVAIPAGVTAIGSYAFYGCSLLDGIVIPEGVTKINERTFYNCTSLKAINIPAGVTSIGEDAFKGCNAITSLVWNARSCSSRGSMPTANIGQVSIGSEVTLLPTDFIKGSKITEVNIPATMVSIGKNAFLNCANLTDVTSRALTPPTMLAQNCFSCYETAILTVSVYAKEDYESTNWWNLFTNTVGVDFDGIDDAFEGDSLYYKITSDTEVCVTYRDKNLNSYSGDIRIPRKTIIDGVVYDVTAIGDSAFYNCTDLTSVLMPYSIKSIGLRSFSSCTKLDNVIIPDSVKTIEESAFYLCRNLKNVTLGNSVTSIGFVAFGQCSLLTNITFPHSVTSIGISAFYYCDLSDIFIPNSVTSIGGGAFMGCRNLMSITVEDGNPNYDSRNNCNAIIESATNTLITGSVNTIIPNTVTSIASSAFCASNISDITFPESVTSIGHHAFWFCTNLTELIIPCTITSMDDSFVGCYGLTRILVDEDNPIYDSRDNCNAIIKTSTNTLIAGCDNSIIPNSVTAIGNYAFYWCRFSSVSIPDMVTSIGFSAFAENKSLKSVTIGKSVINIGQYAFEQCRSLTEVTCLAPTPPTMYDDYCFSCYDKATLYVPAESLELYRTTDWWNCFAHIEAITQEGGDVNGDNTITIADVTTLIDLLLGGGTPPAAADVNGDGSVSIADVTALIDKLLSGN